MAEVTLLPHLVNIGERLYPYTLRRSRKAKHILLHVDIDKGIEVVLPWRGASRDAHAFVNRRRSWLFRVLRRHERLRNSVPRRQFVSGEELPFGGRMLRLQVLFDPARRRRTVSLQGSVLTVRTDRHAFVRPALINWYREQARAFFHTTCTQLTAQANLHFTALSTGNHRTQWGSCTHRARLSFNWRLLLAPLPVAQYVAAHEVAHLRHPNHSAAFWQLVATLNPNFPPARHWLKKQGHTLVF